ncbi:MAG: hypothetical protein J6Y65_04805 [Eggerthellaceae bacterium]|nr:hypothetical protein [Eggerthellaceae bacterium]
MAVIDVDLMNFGPEIQHSEVPVMLCLYAPACAGCEPTLNALDEVSQICGAKLKVCRANVAKHHIIGTAYDLTEVPTTFLIIRGEVAGRIIGERTCAELLDFINWK